MWLCGCEIEFSKCIKEKGGFETPFPSPSPCMDLAMGLHFKLHVSEDKVLRCISPFVYSIVPSGSPSSLTSSATNTSITLSWQPISSEQQNGVLLKYRVTIYTVANNDSEVLETNATSIEIPNLHPFYLYEMVVAAENRAGVGPDSQPKLHQLPEASERIIKWACCIIGSRC